MCCVVLCCADYITASDGKTTTAAAAHDTTTGAADMAMPDIELGEFMLDGPFDLLGQIFNINGGSDYGADSGSWAV